MARVLVPLPSKRNNEACQRSEEDALHRKPQTADNVILRQTVRNLGVEGHQREGLQIRVVAKLLRSRVVLVVLVSPVSRRHATPNTVDDALQRLVDWDDSSERVMSTLMHQPTTTARGDAQYSGSGNKITWSKGKIETESKQGKELGNTVGDVEQVWLEPSLFLELAVKVNKILGNCLSLPTIERKLVTLVVCKNLQNFFGKHLLSLVVLDLLEKSPIIFDGRQCLEHCLGLLGTKVELHKRRGGIGIKTKLDNTSSRVARNEGADVIDTSIDQ